MGFQPLHRLGVFDGHVDQLQYSLLRLQGISMGRSSRQNSEKLRLRMVPNRPSLRPALRRHIFLRIGHM